MNRFIVLFVALLIAQNLQSQNAVITKESASIIIKKINEEMSACKYYSADIEYVIFKTHADTIALERSKGFYKRSASNEHSMLVGVETIQNEKERLVIDSNAQSMVLSLPNSKAQLLEQSMLTALTMCKTIGHIKGKQASVLQFTLDPNLGIGFSKLYITYNNKTHFIENITMYYTATFIPGYEDVSNPKISINYTNISTARVSHSEFKIDQYVQSKGKLYFLNSIYQSYNLFNQLSTENN